MLFTEIPVLVTKSENLGAAGTKVFSSKLSGPLSAFAMH